MGEKLETVQMATKDDRLRISSMGEFYEDLLLADSVLCDRAEAQQATSLLCSKLQEREQKIKARVKYLASKRGLTFEEMWLKILRGEYRKMTPEERQEIESLLPME